MEVSAFIEVLSLGIVFGFGLSAVVGLIGYVIKSALAALRD